MADGLGIRFILEAENRASAVLRQVQGDVERATQATQRGADAATASMLGFDKTLRQTGAGMRTVLMPAMFAVSDGLGSMTARMAGVVGAAAVLPSAFAAIGAAALGVATIIGGQYLDSMRKVREEQLAFDRAIRSMDLSRIAEQAQKAKTGLEPLSEQLAKVNRELDKLRAAPEIPSSPYIARGPGRIAESPFPTRHPEATNQDKIRQLENEKRALEARLEAANEILALERGHAMSGDAAVFRTRNARALRGGFDFLLPPIDQEHAAAFRAAEDLATGTGHPFADPAAADRLRGVARRRREFRYAGEVLGPSLVAASQEWGGFEAGLVAGTHELSTAGAPRGYLDAQRFRAEFAGQMEHDVRPFEGFEGALYAGTDEIAKADRSKQLRQETLDLAVRELAVSRERAEILARVTGLTETQRTHQEMSLSLEREALRIAELDAEIEAAKDDPARQDRLRRQRGLAQLEGAVTRSNAQRELDERTGAAAGFASGLRDMQEDYLAFGNQMKQMSREFGSASARVWSDSFFNVMTGEWKKLNEMPKQFAQAVLRSMTDVAGRMMAGFTAQSIAGAFPGASRYMGSMLPAGVAAPVGGGSIIGGAAVSPIYGAGGEVVGYTAPNVAAAAANAQGAAGTGGISLSQLPTPPLGMFTSGSGYLSALSATPLSNIYSYGLSNAVAGTMVAQSVAAAPTVGASGFLAAESGATMMGTSAGAAAGEMTAGTATGLTASQALGVAGGVIALGFTVYGALQGPPTAENMAMSGVSGAISGAMIGTAIAPGIGTAIGAIAGGILGSGAAALGKEPKKPSASRRSRAAGQAGAAALGRALDAATTLEDLAAAFNTQWAPHGEVQILATGSDGGVYWAGDWDDPPGRLFTADALRTDPGIQQTLVIKVGESGATDVNGDLTDYARAKIKEILAQEANIPFGFLRTVTPEGGGVSYEERTYLPLSGVEQARGQSLFYSPEVLRRDVQLDDVEIERVVHRLRRVARDHGLTAWSRDDFLAMDEM